jgi:hypothetical protein
VLTAEDVIAAVRAVAEGVAAIAAAGVADPAAASIVESELGVEGRLAPDGTIGLAGDEGGASGGAAPAARSGLAPVAAPASGSARGGGGGADAAPLVSAIGDPLCLLEAATVSARLAGVLVGARGVAVLTRTLG